MSGFPLLSALWILPAACALICLLLPTGFRHAARPLALGVSLATLGLAAAVGMSYSPSGERFQLVESRPWIPSLGTGYILGVDGVAVVLVLLTAVIVPLLLVAGWRDTSDADPTDRSTATYVGLFLAVEAMVLLSFIALDVLLFYILFEAMLIPMYFLIGGYGGPNRSRAAVKFLLYNLFGGLIMLAAVIGLYVVTSRPGSGTGGATFDFRLISEAVAAGTLPASAGLINALFLGFMFAFAVKAPLWPLHTWLPDAAVQSTPATAVLMMAVVDKVGTFGMLRYCLQLFPEASRTFAPVIIALAVIGILYGALIAIAQTDMMRLIAFTSISHFGFIILGIFAMTELSQAGSALYMVNHGLSTAALFLIAGFLVSRRGSAQISAFGGVRQVAPVLAGTFLIAGLATLSLPGLAPFISEFLVLVGTFERYRVAAVIASVALVLAAMYVLWLYQRVMTGPPGAGVQGLRDLVPRELVVIVPLIALLIGLGVYPKPALDMITPAVAGTSFEVQPPAAVADGGTP